MAKLSVRWDGAIGAVGSGVLKSKNPYLRYALALLITGLALLLRQWLEPWLGPANPYHTLWLAVVFSAWYCGVGPAIVTVVTGLAGVRYWFLPPYHSFALQDPGQIFGLVGFSLFSAVIIWISDINRRNFQRCQTTENQLRLSQAELENRVSARTEELQGANQNLRELSARLLRLRDEEHRKIARELHDSVGQLLAAISMNIGMVEREGDKISPKAQKLVHENGQMIEQVIKETRTLSYLLHPPQLDEAGLASALHWFVDGFSKRSEIKVTLEIAEDFPRLTEEAETSIFRTVQECLTNIHRHSGSSTADICLSRKSGILEIQVRDEGKGIAADKQRATGTAGATGVGVRGMRERWRQLGGTLEIISTEHGTVVKAMLPEQFSLAKAVGQEAGRDSEFTI